MQSSENILDFLLQKNTGGLTEKDYFKNLTEAFPYFTVSHFYLLKQMNKEDKNFNTQAANTTLLFNNPYWLNFQLNKKNVIENIIIKRANADDITKYKEEVIEADEMPTMKIDLAASIKNAENENALHFEPMHLVDYFASQGIKLSENTIPITKLDNQLKSFSEWIKTMKKIHIANDVNSNPSAEISVQNLAEKSNHQSEIVTEAMAEVFLQQGKVEKAISVYQKLSLLNTDKSAYFATKINQIKVV